MLQRIQTVYMLAGVVAILMLFLFPLATLQIPEATFKLSAFGLTSLTPEVAVDVMRWPLLLALLVLLVLPFVAIFLYKKLNMQLHLLIYTALLDVFFYGYYYFFELDACRGIACMASVGGEVVIEHSLLPAIMPALSLLCCVMAIKGVIKDKLLLASLNRLR